MNIKNILNFFIKRKPKSIINCSTKESFLNKESLCKNKKNALDIVDNNNPLISNFSDSINILTFADTHGYRAEMIDKLKELSEESYDVIFTLGDIPVDMLRDIKAYSKKEVFGILGNHDSEDTLINAGITELDKTSIHINNISFTGMSGSFKYKPSCIGFSQEESIEFFKDKEKADVLISHDTVQSLFKNEFGFYNDDAHQGLEGISDYIANPEVKLNIHGHYHRNLQWQAENKGILSCFGLCLIKIDPAHIYKYTLIEI